MGERCRISLGTIKAALYMEQFMIPYYRSLPGRVIFLQDGGRYHTTKSVLSFREEQRVEIMKWPAQI